MGGFEDVFNTQMNWNVIANHWGFPHLDRFSFSLGVAVHNTSLELGVTSLSSGGGAKSSVGVDGGLSEDAIITVLVDGLRGSHVGSPLQKKARETNCEQPAKLVTKTLVGPIQCHNAYQTNNFLNPFNFFTQRPSAPSLQLGSAPFNEEFSYFDQASPPWL